MIELILVGIGTGNPEHVTLQAIRALNSADIILIPRKGADKADLAAVRLAICADVVTNPATKLVEFDMPRRDAANASYRSGVDDWHDAIALVWSQTIRAHLGDGGGCVALLVWGDPALYDSTLRIAARLDPAPRVRVVPGITSVQALTASHAIPLNEIGAPVLVTTGRQLQEAGWPPCADTLVVMLDGACVFQGLDPAGVSIWWAAYVGLPQEISLAGPLSETGPKIVAARAQARADHGWLMDVYILRRMTTASGQS